MSDSRGEDADLVAAFVESGRVQDFERLIERHQRSVFRVVVSVLGPGRDRDAEEVTQDVLVQVYRRLASFERRSRFSTWLYRIAYNRALDVRRSIRARPDSEALVADVTAPSNADDVLRSRALADCVSRLPDAQRAAVHLHYWLGHTVTEISEMLGVHSGTVKAWLFRARHLLARCLASKGVRL